MFIYRKSYTVYINRNSSDLIRGKVQSSTVRFSASFTVLQYVMSTRPAAACLLVDPGA